MYIIKMVSKKINSNEFLTYLFLIIIGYMAGKLFMNKCNRFSVGGEEKCTDNASCCGGCADNNICASHSSNSDKNVCSNRYYTNADGKNIRCAYGKTDQTMGDYCHNMPENAEHGSVDNASCSKCEKKVCTGSKRTPNCGGKTRTKETCTGYTKPNVSNNESKNLELGYQCVWVDNKKSCDSYASWNEQGRTLCTLPSGSGSPPAPAGNTSPPVPAPAPTVSCSSTGFFGFSDKCLKNGSAVEDTSNDSDCQNLKDCKYSAFSPSKFSFWLIIVAIMAIIITIWSTRH
jgi:hypothetical protein